MLNHIINLSTLFAMIQGWASITDKIREFAFVLKGALVGNDFSCKVNQILRGMPPPSPWICKLLQILKQQS